MFAKTMARFLYGARIGALVLGGTGALHAASLSTPPGLAYQLTHAVTVDPSFSPDGKRMVYITVVAGKEQLFTARADRANPRPITLDDHEHDDTRRGPGRRQ